MGKEKLLALSQMDTETHSPDWLKQAVFYQIYLQSFYDSNGDGIGDIPGIIQKLDYLQWLGINVVWVNPCFVSPFRDAGYDVDDYCRIAPRYGTNRDLFRLCREAHRRGIKVCLDLVAGHTSIDHLWFKASCRQKRNRYSDRYIWTSSNISKSNSTLSLGAVMIHMSARILAVLREDKPYDLRDMDGRPVTREEARRIILSKYQVPEEIRRERRHRKTPGNYKLQKTLREMLVSKAYEAAAAPHHGI
jgi:hypothetical protein